MAVIVRDPSDDSPQNAAAIQGQASDQVEDAQSDVNIGWYLVRASREATATEASANSPNSAARTKLKAGRRW